MQHKPEIENACLKGKFVAFEMCLLQLLCSVHTADDLLVSYRFAADFWPLASNSGSGRLSSLLIYLLSDLMSVGCILLLSDYFSRLHGISTMFTLLISHHLEVVECHSLFMLSGLTEGKERLRMPTASVLLVAHHKPR